MNIALTWNLFVLAFFCIILAYSMMIGRNQTLKIIICTYVAILTADGISNLLARVAPPFIAVIFPGTDSLTAGLVLKIALFVFVIVFLSMKGNFQVTVDDESSKLVTFVLNVGFGLLSAALLLSTILVYVSGGSFLQLTVGVGNDAIESIKRSSPLVQNLVEYYNVWFAAPAMAFAAASFLKK